VQRVEGQILKVFTHSSSYSTPSPTLHVKRSSKFEKEAWHGPLFSSRVESKELNLKIKMKNGGRLDPLSFAYINDDRARF